MDFTFHTWEIRNFASKSKQTNTKKFWQLQKTKKFLLKFCFVGYFDWHLTNSYEIVWQLQKIYCWLIWLKAYFGHLCLSGAHTREIRIESESNFASKSKLEKSELNFDSKSKQIIKTGEIRIEFWFKIKTNFWQWQ